jgi:glycerophosphoryl diester phosphodiesterase
MELFAVTMPARRALSGLGLLLRSRGIHTYAHTVNDPKGLAILQQKCGINDVYTDFLPPE